MEKHQFKITISGTPSEAAEKVKVLAELARQLTTKELRGIVELLKKDPAAAQFAKDYMGI